MLFKQLIWLSYEQERPGQPSEEEKEVPEQPSEEEGPKPPVSEDYSFLRRHITRMSNARRYSKHDITGFKSTADKVKNSITKHFHESVLPWGYDKCISFISDLAKELSREQDHKAANYDKYYSQDCTFYEACYNQLLTPEWTDPTPKPLDITPFTQFLSNGEKSEKYWDDTKLWFMQLYLWSIFECEIDKPQCTALIKNPDSLRTILVYAQSKIAEEEKAKNEQDVARKAALLKSKQISTEAKWYIQWINATKKEKALLEAQPESWHQLVKMPLPDLKTLQDEINRNEEILKRIAKVAGYPEEQVKNLSSLSEPEIIKISAVAKLVMWDPEKDIQWLTEATNILLSGDDDSTKWLDGFLINCANKVRDKYGIDEALWDKLFAISENIVKDHRASFEKAHKSGQKLSEYKYSRQEVKQIQFCLSVYQGQQESSKSYPLPHIDGVLVPSEKLNLEQEAKLETNWFVYALEIRGELNKYIFEQLELIGKDNRQVKKKVVVHFSEYYSQLRDFYVGKAGWLPTQLLKNYFTALVNQAIDPNAVVRIKAATPDPMDWVAKVDNKETTLEMSISDYSLLVESQVLDEVTKVRFAEYKMKMALLEKKLKQFQDGWAEWSKKWKLSKAMQRQVDAYAELLKQQKIADVWLDELRSTTESYNAWSNIFLGLGLTTSDEEVVDAFSAAEKGVSGLKSADDEFMCYSNEFRETMYDMHLLQWERLHRNKENYDKIEDLNKTKNPKSTNPIPFNASRFDTEAENIALSIFLLGQDEGGKILL